MLSDLIPFIHYLLQFSSTPLPSVHFHSSLIFSTLTFYLQSISFCVLSLAILSLYDFLPPLFISFLPILPFTSNLSPFMYFLFTTSYLHTSFLPILLLLPTFLHSFSSSLVPSALSSLTYSSHLLPSRVWQVILKLFVMSPEGSVTKQTL